MITRSLFGRRYYPSVNELFEKSDVGEESSSNMYNIFKYCHYFDGTLQYMNNITGEMEYYPAVGSTSNDVFNPGKLANYFKEKFGSRRLAKPLNPYLARMGYDEAIRAYISDFITQTVNYQITLEYKYLQLMKTESVMVDPVMSYDLIKEGNSNKGDVTFTHTPDLTVKAASTMVSSKSATLGSAGGDEPSITLWDSTAKTSTDKALGSGGPQTDHYTTTYDDSSNGRLESYDVQRGGTEHYEAPSAQAVKSNSEKYTDTTSQSKEDSFKEGVKDLSKIENARALANINVVDMFMDEVAGRWLLSTWD